MGGWGLKFTEHRVNHLKVDNSEAFSTFTMSYNHLLCLVLKHSCKRETTVISTPTPALSPALDNR